MGLPWGLEHPLIGRDGLGMSFSSRIVSRETIRFLTHDYVSSETMIRCHESRNVSRGTIRASIDAVQPKSTIHRQRQAFGI